MELVRIGRLSLRRPIGPKYMIVDVSAGNGADATYTVSYSDEHPHPGSIAYKDRGTDPALNTQIILRRVDAGTYLMGSPESELGRSQTGSRGSC